MSIVRAILNKQVQGLLIVCYSPHLDIVGQKFGFKQVQSLMLLQHVSILSTHDLLYAVQDRIALVVDRAKQEASDHLTLILQILVTSGYLGSWQQKWHQYTIVITYCNWQQLAIIEKNQIYQSNLLSRIYQSQPLVIATTQLPILATNYSFLRLVVATN